VLSVAAGEKETKVSRIF